MSKTATALAPQLNPYKWKPGQSGNPRGPAPGTRRKLAEDFVADLHDSWTILGKAAITTVAWTDPSTYLKVIASIVPKDIEVTVTDTRLERMSTSEIENALRELRARREDADDPLEAQEGEDKVFRVD